MRPNGWGSGERAQSEVTSVILMVAIAVVLAGAIGHMVFGLDIVQSGEQNVGPQIAFETTINDAGDLVIEHQSGDNADTDELTVTRSEQFDPTIDWDGEGVEGEWEAGESIEIPVNDGETVRIIWQSSTSDETAVIFNHEVDK